jgi:hypothetical protein
MTDQRKITLPGASNAFDPMWRSRLEAERTRCALMLDRAVAHPDVAGIVPAAPARGPMVISQGFEALPGGTRRQAGIRLRELSPLAQMVANARMRHEARDYDADFVAPFTPGQVQVSEDYRALVERHEAGLVKCSSTEAGRGGVGGSGLAIDRFIDDGRFLDVLRIRIGDGVAMSVRRNMDRGNGRKAITMRALVDQVVLVGRDFSFVLARHGWQADGKNRKALRLALCGALDRMQGYRDG